MSEKEILFHLEPGGTISGDVRVPGDKSISHRSIMLGSIADGVSEVTGFLEGEDALATLNAFRSLGVTIEGPASGRVIIHGVGINGLKAPATPLDLGNSGTSMRLLAGLLSGQPFDVELIGDESLSRRPMRRVADPLTTMGALIDTAEGGTPPLHIHGGQRIRGIDYALPVASAQVKSALLLAGLYAEGVTSVVEPAPTRDHSERMLRGFGYPVTSNGNTISLSGGGRLRACSIDIPGDISSAAFLLVAGSIAGGDSLTIRHVGINPTRTGVIDILLAMGAKIELENRREIGGEPVADLKVRPARLHGIDIPPELVPLAIDEFPALFIAAACASGTTRLSGAEELRVKESDRIQVMANGLRRLGVDAEPTPDGMIINGGSNFDSGEIDSQGDHRIAMSFAIAALRADGPITIGQCANVATSFPGFVDLMQRLGLKIREESA